MDERAVAAFRLTFQRTLNEGEMPDKIPRTRMGWPCQRDFRKWPVTDQREWVCAPIFAYLEDGLGAGEPGEDGPAMHEAWNRIFQFLEHVGVNIQVPSLLGDATAEDLLLEHYRRGEGYDCEQVAIDFTTFPPIAKGIREARRRAWTQDDTRRRQKRDSKKRRRATDALANDCDKVGG